MDLSQKDFADRLGIAKGTLENYEAGKRLPTADILIKFAHVTGVTLDWLLLGKGPAPVPELRVLTLHEARKTLTPQEIKDSWAELPLVAEEAAAGPPLLVPSERIEEWLLAPKLWVRHENYSCIRVRGRSMLPVLGEGDIVAVNHDRKDLRELRGRVVAFEVPEEGVTLKYGDLVNDIICMRAQNEVEWPARHFKAEDVKLIGVVEWAWRRFE